MKTTFHSWWPSKQKTGDNEWFWACTFMFNIDILWEYNYKAITFSFLFWQLSLEFRKH